jgi:hypothetical protein
VASQTLEITLSTTSVGVDQLAYDTTDGPDVKIFGTFTIGGGTSPTTLTFAGSPFDYGPANGNLLIDIITLSSSTSDFFTFAFYESDNTGNVTSRFCKASECGENQGLVTRFDSTSVPEVASVPYLLLGFSICALISFCGSALNTASRSKRTY